MLLMKVRVLHGQICWLPWVQTGLFLAPALSWAWVGNSVEGKGMGDKIAEPQLLVSWLLISIVLIPNRNSTEWSGDKSVWEMSTHGWEWRGMHWQFIVFPFIFSFFIVFTFFSLSVISPRSAVQWWKACMSKVMWKPFVLVLFFM